MLAGILVEIDLRGLRLLRVLVYGKEHRAANFQGLIEACYHTDEPWVPIQIDVAVKTDVI